MRPKSKQIPTTIIMYRTSIRLNKLKKRCLGKLGSNWVQRELLLVPCSEFKWTSHECSKPKPLPESRIKGAQCRDSQVLRSLVLCSIRHGAAKPMTTLPFFISTIYEGHDQRFCRVHPLELASRKKYSRTHHYSIQTISFFQ